MPAPESSLSAWEPLTPHGVAVFARAKTGRLLLVQFIFAVLAAAAATLFLRNDCFPTIHDAIEQLPASGQIRDGKLTGFGDAPQLLAEGPFLGLVVDLKHTGQIHSTAPMQIEFGMDSIRVGSLAGYQDFIYPAGWFYFNRPDLEPLWGAWQPDMLLIAAVTAVIGLMISWILLAALYVAPVRLICFFTNRDLTGMQCWRLAGAALMPGALLLAVALLLFTYGGLDLIGICFAFGAHLVLGWIYLFISPLFLPRSELSTSRGNPFK